MFVIKRSYANTLFRYDQMSSLYIYTVFRKIRTPFLKRNQYLLIGNFYVFMNTQHINIVWS